MPVETIFGGFDKNLTYIYYDQKGGTGLVVDAACPAADLLKAISSLELTIRFLVLTHSHGDHIVSAREVSETLGATVAGFGEEAREVVGIPPERYLSLEDGDVVEDGALVLEVLHTPGHYPDSICLVGMGVVFTGDTLFVGRTGRTIGARSDTVTLYESIRDKVMPLPNNLVTYPGHDYGDVASQTMEEQRATNRFLSATSAEDFCRIMEEYEASRG